MQEVLRYACDKLTEKSSILSKYATLTLIYLFFSICILHVSWAEG